MPVPEKVVVVGPAARQRIFKGAFLVTSAVKSTLGPYGSNALLEKGMKPTNDGVTVAREIQAKDEIEQLGVRKIQEIASATNDEVGDGTTTAVTLADGILKEADRFLPSEKKIGAKTPIQIVQQIESERKFVIGELERIAEKITTEQQLIEVATVSVEDKELGELIGKTQWELGEEGVLLAEEVNERVCSVERVRGIRIDNGFGSSTVINNHAKQSLDLKDVKVIYTNHTLTSLLPIQSLLQSLVTAGFNEIVILARAFTDGAIQDCLKNAQAGIGIYPLNAPYTDQAQVMKDLEAILGGAFIDKDTMTLEDAQLSQVGHAAFIEAKRSSTIITGREDEHATKRVETRVAELKTKHEKEGSEFEKKNLTTRMAQLQNGFAILKIGAVSIAERQYKKDKADDAVNSVRAAFQEGVVPGAGQAFKTIADNMEDTSILKKALMGPYDQIRLSAPPDFEVPEWVKDPVKVLRIALEKACSVSGMLSTIEIAIATEKEKPRFIQEGSPTAEEDEE